MVVAVAESAGLDVQKGAFFHVCLGRQYVTLGTFRWGCRIGYGGCCSGIGWLGRRERTFFKLSLGRQYVTLGSFRWGCRISFVLFFGLCI